jgi:glycosyltransferase involved in cell wall biosynthesis
MSLQERLTQLQAVRLLRRDPLADMTLPVSMDEEQRFLLWWMLSGQREYAATQVALTQAQRRLFFQPLAGWPVTGGLGMNLLLRSLFTLRGDLQRAFDITSPVGVWDAVAWFYITGIKELGLGAFVDDHSLALLNAPAFSEAGVQPSWLMVLLWRTQPQLQRDCDLERPQGRDALLRWFAHTGMTQFGLEQLVLPRAPAPPVRRALPPSDKPSFGVNLIGFAFGELGIGEDLRMAAQACASAGVPFKVLNIDPGKHLRQADRLVAPHSTDDIADLPYAINIFCLTGFDTLRVYAAKGEALFDGRYNIGWWPWELPVWPQRWTQAFTVLDEVWAATRFTKTMYRAHTDRPVTLMPLPVSVDRLKKTSRRALGLPARRFLFLFIFDFNSYIARKNPEAAIQAFAQAFSPDDKSVGLVLKTMNSRPDDPAWGEFKRQCAADARITLLDHMLDREVVLGLVNACDAYVSLHRSEGFGRTLAEAMLLGKPVVGTDYSGNRDFLNRRTGYPVKWTQKAVGQGEYPFVEEADAAFWADPDIAHAARQMRRAKTAAASPWARQLPQQVAERFSPQTIGARMLAVLKKRFAAL